MMAATTISVRIVQKKDIIVAWTFIDICKNVCSVEELFRDIKDGKFPHIHWNKKAYLNLTVTGCKTSTDHKLLQEITAPPSSDIVQKAKLFGMLFFTIVVEHPDDCELCKKSVETAASKRPNAFELIIANARAQYKDSVPKEIENPKNGKDKQYNKIICHLAEKNCVINPNAATTGARFVAKFANALWYVDGHTDRLEKESSRVFPPSFKGLLGFNKPEKSKHRKREIGNLSGNKLSELSLVLNEAVQALSFASSRDWCALKIECLKLAQVMDDYTSHLSETKNKMLKLHAKPLSNIEKNANVKELPVTEHPAKVLQPLDIKLQNVEMYTLINVREFLEGTLDRKEIYNLIHDKLHLGGLTVKSVHYSYLPGGQKQAFHFVWSVPEKSDDIIQKCVNVIRQIESDMPRYERRVTVKSFKDTFGFVTSKVALRAMFRDLTGDKSAPLNLCEKEIDERMNFALLTEDT